MNYTGLPFTAQCYSRYFHIAANEPEVLARLTSALKNEYNSRAV